LRQAMAAYSIKNYWGLSNLKFVDWRPPPKLLGCA
jgi:hypothetical protein